MIYLTPGQSWETTAVFPSGLLGTIGVRLNDNAGVDTIPRTTTGVTEFALGAGYSLYSKTLVAPGSAGQFTPLWDDAVHPSEADEQIFVSFSAVVTPPIVTDAYATLADVKARAGRLSGAWTDQSTPSNTDITTFLAIASDEIDAVLGARGFATPLTPGSPAANALRGLNADAALLVALKATFPEEDGPASSEMVDDIRKRYEAAFATLVAGKHPAVLLLEAGADAPSGSSFWRTAVPVGTELEPAFRRGQVF